MKIVPVVVLLALVSACAGNPSMPTSPGQTGPVLLTAQINRTQLASGQTAVVVFRLANVTPQPVTLDFSSGCQVMPYVRKRPSNEIVHPSGGGWACTAVITQLTLAPNSTTERELKVIAGGAAADHVTLGPGSYSIFAKLDDRVHKLESNQVALTIQ